MKIEITGTAKEIAALVAELQERQGLKDLPRIEVHTGASGIEVPTDLRDIEGLVLCKRYRAPYEKEVHYTPLCDFPVKRPGDKE